MVVSRRTLWMGLLSLLLTLAALGLTPPRPASAPSLPAPAGWKAIHAQNFSQFPWGLDAHTAAAMREFSLLRRRTTEYIPASAASLRHAASRDRLSTTVWSFSDSRGAYGAQTYLRALPVGQAVRSTVAQAPAPVGQASSPASGQPAPSTRRLARRHWLLTASGPVSTHAWRRWVAAIAGKTPSPLPLLRQRLPRRGLIAHSAAYAEGPASLAVAAPWLPPQAVNFAMEPMIATGRYQLIGAGPSPAYGRSPRLRAGETGDPVRPRLAGASWHSREVAGQLAILSYPTPQIAAAQLKPIRAVADLAQRSGSLVVAWHGPLAPQAGKLVAAVQYDPMVTWNHPLHPKTLPGLVLAIFALVAFILGACVVVGFFAGGVRVLLARLFPRRFTLRPDRFIRLKLNAPPNRPWGRL